MTTPALILDCDGVLAETERDGHRRAFNATFADVGVPVYWSSADYQRMLRVGGGKERMATLLTPEFVARNGLPSEPDEQRDLMQSWYRRKSDYYIDMARTGQLPARPGIARLAVEAAGAGWTLAVASTSGEQSVRAVLDQVLGALADRFTVFAGDIVPNKKPAPDIYRLAVQELRVDPASSLVIEDSRNGLAAALAAGLTTVVTISSYTANEDFTGAALVLSSLGDDQHPARVLADPFHVHPRPQVGLTDLESVLSRASQHRQEAS